MNFEFDSENENLLINDTDLYLKKPFTDLVIKGHARSGDSIKNSEVVVPTSLYDNSRYRRTRPRRTLANNPGRSGLQD